MAEALEGLKECKIGYPTGGGGGGWGGGGGVVSALLHYEYAWALATHLGL